VSEQPDAVDRESKNTHTGSVVIALLRYVVAYHRVLALLLTILGLFLSFESIFWWFIAFGGFGAVLVWTGEGIRKRKRFALLLAMIIHSLFVVWAVLMAVLLIPTIYGLWELWVHHYPSGVSGAFTQLALMLYLFVAAASIPIGLKSFRCIRILRRAEIRAWFAALDSVDEKGTYRPG
jgi:hypothetical protein